MIANSPPTPPWLAANLLPPCPELGTTGIISQQGPRLAENAEIVDLIRRGEASLVWTPEQTHVVPAEEIPWLHAAVTERDTKPMQALRKRQLNQAALFAAIGIAPLFFRDLPPLYLFLIFAIMHGGEAFSIHLQLRLMQRDPAKACLQRAAIMRFTWWSHAVKLKNYRTVGLIGAIVGCYFMQIAAGSQFAIAQAGLIPNAVDQGEYWRLWSYAFLHGDPSGLGLAHIIFNMLALWYLGRLLEQIAHAHLLFPLFAVAAVAGGVASALATPFTASVGASAGILGIFGYLIALIYVRKNWLPPSISSSLVRNLMLLGSMAFIPGINIDHWAHAGGLLTGMIWCWAFPPPPLAGTDPDRDPLSRLGDRLGLACVVLGVGIIWWRLAPMLQA